MNNKLLSFPTITDTQYPFLIPSLIILGALLVVAVVIFLVIKLRSKKANKSIDNNEWFVALGEKENIKEVSGVGSRLTLVLVDKEKIDREKLKSLGVSSVLTMSNKVTLVIEGQAEKILENLKKDL